MRYEGAEERGVERGGLERVFGGAVTEEREMEACEGGRVEVVQDPAHGVDGIGEGERADGGGAGDRGDGARGVESLHEDFAGVQAGQGGERGEVAQCFVDRDWGEDEWLEVGEGAHDRDCLGPVTDFFVSE